MRNSPKRSRVHKGKSAGAFRHDVSKSHPNNLRPRPQRGGWRL